MGPQRDSMSDDIEFLDEPEAARGLERWHPNAYVVPGAAPTSVDPLSGAPTGLVATSFAATDVMMMAGSRSPPDGFSTSTTSSGSDR
jgi:hypothetical protein